MVNHQFLGVGKAIWVPEAAKIIKTWTKMIDEKDRTPFPAAQAKHFQPVFSVTPPRGSDRKDRLEVLCLCSGKGGPVFFVNHFGPGFDDFCRLGDPNRLADP